MIKFSSFDRRATLLFSKRFSAQEISGVPLETVRLRYRLIVECGGDQPRVEYALTSDNFTLIDGTATLGGQLLRSAHLSRTGVHWAETLDGLGYLTGVFRFSPDRLSLRGYMHFGPDAQNMTRYEVFGAVQRQNFDIKTASGRRAKLNVGYSGGSVRSAPEQTIEMNGHDISHRARFEHVPGTGLRLHIERRAAPLEGDSSWLLGGWLHLDLGEGPSYGMVELAGAASGRLRNERWSATSSLPIGSSSLHIGPSDAIVTQAPPSGTVDCSTLKLKVEGLASCDLSGSEAASQALIQQNMLWSMDQDWVDAFFPSKGSPSRPDFSSQFSRMNAVDQDCEWYNMRFAASFLGLAIDDKAHKLSSSDRLTLEYYLASQIAMDPAYTRQTQAIATLAAVTASPTLGCYVADAAQNGTNWGQQLSDYLNDPDQLASLVNLILNSPEGGAAQLTDNGTLLTVFDETGQLPSNYYNNVVLAVMAALALDADVSLDTTLTGWLPDYIDDFIQNYFTGKTRPAEPGPDQVAFDVAEDLYQGSVAAVNSAGLAQLIYENAQKNPGQPMGQQAANVAENISEATNGKVTVAKSLFSVFLAAGIVTSIYAITNWDSLPPDAQAAALVNLTTVVYQVGSIVPDIANGAAWASAGFYSGVQKALMATAPRAALQSSYGTFSLEQPTLINRFFAWLEPLAQRGANYLNLASTRLGNLFKNAANLVKGLGAAFAAAGLAISIWTLVSDVQSGADAVNIVFDAVQVVLGAVMVVCGVLALIPVVDVVAGIIGAATAILSGLVAAAQFLYNLLNTQPDPVGDFFSNLVEPLIASLPPAPSGWAPPQPA